MSDIFADFPTAPPAPSRRRAAASLIAALTCLSLIAAAGAAVPTFLLGNNINAAVGWWNDIEVDLADLPTDLPGHVNVVDAAGNQYATFYSENRVALDTLDQINPVMIDAVLAVEDDGFYTHGPIDVMGTGRALVRNQLNGTNQGGSTITQQYVKNLRLTAAQTHDEKTEAVESSIHRKIVELKWASKLEEVISKDEILLGYLNVANFGNGAYGVGAAAQFYFGVPASDLTLPQAALLTGILKSPTGYNPFTHPEAAANRRATVIARMVTAGRITPEEADQASATELGAVAHPLPNGCNASPYPYYCQWVKNILLSDPAFGEDDAARERNLFQGGFTVHTALDPADMAAAQGAVDAAFTHDNTAAAAIATVEPGTGRVSAIAQTRDWSQTQFIYPVQAQLQSGSTFKPITYAAALEQGFDPAATLSSSSGYKPAAMNAPAGGFTNVDGHDRGWIDVNTAMKYSVNTWFVRLVEKVGTQQIADVAYRLGMSSMDPATRRVGKADASITLGAFETTPLDMANVYATLAASGKKCRPLPITGVVDLQGNALPAPDPACEQVIDPAVANTVAAAMTTTFTPGGTADGLALDRPATGKTGTTNAFGATWFAGFTPQHATAVWVGDPRGPSHPLQNVVAFGQRHAQLFGSTVAGPVWQQAMLAFSAGEPVVELASPGPLTASGRAVPSVVGLSLPAAISALQEAGYEPTIAEKTAPVAGARPDVVARQSPGAGGAATDGAVTLTLTDGSDTSVQVAAQS